MAYEIAEDKNAELAKNTKSNDKTSEKVNVMPKDETTEEIETNTKEIEPSEMQSILSSAQKNRCIFSPPNWLKIKCFERSPSIAKFSHRGFKELAA